MFFIFGLFLGSFLNNIALRLERNEDYLFSRSKCPNCGKVLTWKELIPLLSFLIQKGRCKNCSTKISLRYPLVEIFTGLWVYLLAKTILPSGSALVCTKSVLVCVLPLIEFLFYLIFLSVLFVLALYDLKTFLVDDRLILFGIIVGFLFWGFKIYFQITPRDFSYLFNYLFFQFGKFEPIFSALFLSSIFLLIYLVTQGKGLGFGDVKTAFLMGLFLRLGDGILSIVFASLLGSIYGIYLILKNKKFHQPIPFVPFFFLGTLMTIFFGQTISKFYFSFFEF
ncbi:MAG: type 4 prepilin-like proteins leader peptide-processing enzyme [Candidatus Parcubacteria bacterium]|nr:MAG: type 4 prepilin-like proteins leader peptide-processing enzyme [Candidatus Parcubacteria bacterium]